MAKKKIDHAALNEIGDAAIHNKNDKLTDPAKKTKEKKKPEPYLGGPETVANGRVDLDKRLHKALKGLGNATTTDDNKVVSLRRLMTEATLDLLEKYEKKKGKYEFDQDQDWSWKEVK